MCLPSKILWCFVLLLVASSSEFQKNSMNSDKQSDSSTVWYDLFVSSIKYRNDKIETARCNSCVNCIKNDGEMQYELNINSTKNDCKNDDSLRYKSREYIKDCEESNQMSMESSANSTKINDSILQEIKSLSKIKDESNSTSYEYGNFNIKYNNNGTAIIVPHKACKNVTCIQLCCPHNYNLTITDECVPAGKGNYSFPDFYEIDSEDKIDRPLYLTIYEPCFSQGYGRSLLDREEYLFLVDGSLLLKDSDEYIPRMFYCFAIQNEDIYDAMICTNIEIETYISVGLLVSLPFLLLTFVVYSILPELQNIHGYALRAYVASLFVTYVIMYYSQHNSEIAKTKIICTILAYIFNFFVLSSFFWLNVVSFNIWWTFRKLRSCRMSVKEGKRKFVIYSIYAWGAALILTVICAIIDNVPVTKNNWIQKPKMCSIAFWFNDDRAKVVYFYVPVCVTVVSNLCFFITTTVTILYQNIRTTHQLRDSESKRHNDNKQRSVSRKNQSHSMHLQS